MKPLVKLVRHGNKALHQAAKRLLEHSLMLIPPHIVKDLILGPVVKKMSKILSENIQTEFNFIIFKGFRIDSSLGNRCLTCNQTFVLVKIIFQDAKGNLKIAGNELEILGDLYKKPWPSSSLDIFEVKAKVNVLKVWNLEQITHKNLSFPYNDNFIVMPMLHDN